VHQVGHWLRLY